MIKFGTDGWRGIIADDFTLENVRIVARALAAYVLKHEDPARGVVVGHDNRFGGEMFTRATAEELTRAGIGVLLTESPSPTPVISFAVKHFGAAGGVMITASHNPWPWSGVKFKGSYGGSASPTIVSRVEGLLGEPVAAATRSAEIRTVDFRTPYLAHVGKLVNLETIRGAGRRFMADPLFGSGCGYLAEILGCEEIHGYRDPLFPGLNPEPIEPHTDELAKRVVRDGFDAGFALDGDADRLGAVDGAGNFVDSHRIFAILLEHRARRGERGEVAKTFSTSKMIDRIAERHGFPLHETGIGFKYICDLMLERDILVGGEESGGIGVRGHLPERDGIVNSVLLAEAMAERGKGLSELVEELHENYGPQEYGRRDLHLGAGRKERVLAMLKKDPPKRVAGQRVLRMEDKDGVKFFFSEEAWVLLRVSGTEPLLRLYCEMPSREEVGAVLNEVEHLVATT